MVRTSSAKLPGLLIPQAQKAPLGSPAWPRGAQVYYDSDHTDTFLEVCLSLCLFYDNGSFPGVETPFALLVPGT